MSDPKHGVITTDEIVRGAPGSVAQCSCGWSSAWATRDGSAESDAHHHRAAHDPNYRSEHLARLNEYNDSQRADGCTCERFTESYGSVLDLECPLHRPRADCGTRETRRVRCHSCSCHLNPPCSACEHCMHYDYPDCSNDCWDCDEHEEGEQA